MSREALESLTWNSQTLRKIDEKVITHLIVVLKEETGRSVHLWKKSRRYDQDLFERELPQINQLIVVLGREKAVRSAAEVFASFAREYDCEYGHVWEFTR